MNSKIVQSFLYVDKYSKEWKKLLNKSITTIVKIVLAVLLGLACLSISFQLPQNKLI